MFVEDVWSQSSKWYQTWDDKLLYSRENGVRWAVILYSKSMGSVLVVWIQMRCCGLFVPFLSKLKKKLSKSEISLEKSEFVFRVDLGITLSRSDPLIHSNSRGVSLFNIKIAITYMRITGLLLFSLLSCYDSNWLTSIFVPFLRILQFTSSSQ